MIIRTQPTWLCCRAKIKPTSGYAEWCEYDRFFQPLPLDIPCAIWLAARTGMQDKNKSTARHELAEPERNSQKNSRRAWARNQMGNPS